MPPTRVGQIARLQARSQGNWSALPWCDAGVRMTDMRHLPTWLMRANVLRAILCAEGCELDSWNNESMQTQLEMFVRSATWHLGWLEAEMGFSDGQLVGLGIPERRDRIIGRLRGWRLPTMWVTHQVANAYQNGDVEIIMDYVAHNINIRFISVSGTPANLLDLIDELCRVLPARLGVRWDFRFLVWGELLQNSNIWQNQLNAGITWDQLRVTPPGLVP